MRWQRWGELIDENDDAGAPRSVLDVTGKVGSGVRSAPADVRRHRYDWNASCPVESYTHAAMRFLPFASIAIAWTASAGPMKCPAGTKRFDCHQLAMNAHLGVGGKVDLGAAKALYADACAQREGASCNNLGVLAVVHPELAPDIDPKALFENGCKRLDSIACDNSSDHDSRIQPVTTTNVALSGPAPA